MGRGFAIGSFVLGGLAGAVLGVLYAPRSGVESRALIADKVDEVWGEGQLLCTQGVDKGQEGIAGFQPTIDKTNDELRDKINAARSLIADQVVKNAAAAHDAISEKVPAAAEMITQAVDVVQGQLDAAAEKFKSRFGDERADVTAPSEVTEDVVDEATQKVQEAAEAVAEAADSAVEGVVEAAAETATEAAELAEDAATAYAEAVSDPTKEQ